MLFHSSSLAHLFALSIRPVYCAHQPRSLFPVYIRRLLPFLHRLCSSSWLLSFPSPLHLSSHPVSEARHSQPVLQDLFRCAAHHVLQDYNSFITCVPSSSLHCRRRPPRPPSSTRPLSCTCLTALMSLSVSSPSPTVFDNKSLRRSLLRRRLLPLRHPLPHPRPRPGSTSTPLQSGIPTTPPRSLL